MKKLALIIGLALAPTGLGAQGLPVDFDADFFENQSPRQDIEPPAVGRIATATSAHRAVRYGEQTVAAERTRPVTPPRPNPAGRGGS